MENDKSKLKNKNKKRGTTNYTDNTNPDHIPNLILFY